MLYVRVFSINIDRMNANLYAMHGWYEICLEKTPLVKNRECVLIKHIIPTGLKLMIINPLFVDVSFLLGEGHIYV